MKKRKITQEASRINGPLFNRIRNHPRLPFAEIEFDVTDAEDMSGSLRAHLFNESTPRAERWLEQLKALMKVDNKRLKRRKCTDRDGYLPGMPGRLPRAKHLGEVTVEEYRIFGETHVSCPCIELVVILVDQKSQKAIGVTTFGLSVLVGSKSIAHIAAEVFYVWLSSTYRGKGVSKLMSDVVATSLVRYHDFLDNGLDDVPVEVEFELIADTVSSAGHAFLANCGLSFPQQFCNEPRTLTWRGAYGCNPT